MYLWSKLYLVINSESDLIIQREIDQCGVGLLLLYILQYNEYKVIYLQYNFIIIAHNYNIKYLFPKLNINN